MSVGTNVAYYRKHMGWTQAQLAKHLRGMGCNMYQQTIQRIESDAREMRLSEGFAIANVLGCSVQQIAGADDPERLELEASFRAAIKLLTRALKEGNRS